jgi:hypothetical protein
VRLTELADYSLSQAIVFRDKLNPELFKSGRMLPRVKNQLLKIAQDFQDFLGIDNLEIADITISGSNAAYTYTPHSDIDLHLLVDIQELDNSDVYRELFDAKKYQYNNTRNIKIAGYDVELYVQDSRQEHASLGIYSILHDTWVSKPKQTRPEVNDLSVRAKVQSLTDRIHRALHTQDLNQAQTIWDSIKTMRKAGLSSGGEFSPENLAFKVLRTQGLNQKLVNHIQDLKDSELSLPENSV